jgi:nucleotide-binding universal stress UspA family protein
MANKVVTIATLTYSRAELLKAQLEASGIECFLSNINVIRTTIGTGVKVKVNESDVDAALQIVLSLDEEYGKDQLEKQDIVEDISRILVPVDFSSYSKKACLFAIGIANRLNAEITLMHSYYFDTIPIVNFAEPYSYQLNASQSITELKNRAEKEMEKLRSEIITEAKSLGYENLEINLYVAHGTPEEDILQYSNEYKPGVIILGTKSSDKNVDSLFGNITATIIEKAKVPVLVIPEKSHFSGVNKTNILYATDFDKSDYMAIRKLMTLIYLFDVKIYCVHIGNNKWDSLHINKMKNHFAVNYSGYEFECSVIHDDNILSALQQFIRSKSIDIISMTTHKRNFITKLLEPSLTRKMLFNNDTPLLVFHAE